MPLYKLTYEFESSSGNIEYQTTQQVEQAENTTNAEIPLVNTGISLEGHTIEGIAIVELSDTAVPADIFDSATEIQQIEIGSGSAHGDNGGESKPAADPQPAEDIARFKQREDMADRLADVSETPGCGFLLYSNLSRCQPFERDLWFVPMSSTELDADAGVTTGDIIEFYHENLDLLEEQPALKIGGYHSVGKPTIQLFLVASLTDPQEAQALAERTDSAGAINLSRFELTKASVVIGEATHGPGRVDATFQNDTGEMVRSRASAYQMWHEGLNVSYHPLGVIVDGDLYRPVTTEQSDRGTADIGDPIPLTTYRGAEGKPWQFGLTRHNN